VPIIDPIRSDPTRQRRPEKRVHRVALSRGRLGV
jgi:hypothetical protein